MTRQFLINTLAGATLATMAVTAIGGDSTDTETRYTGATELQWGASGFGPTVSAVNGDLSKGGHVSYVKFTAGMTTHIGLCLPTWHMLVSACLAANALWRSFKKTIWILCRLIHKPSLSHPQTT